MDRRHTARAPGHSNNSTVGIGRFHLRGVFRWYCVSRMVVRKCRLPEGESLGTSQQNKLGPHKGCDISRSSELKRFHKPRGPFNRGPS